MHTLRMTKAARVVLQDLDHAIDLHSDRLAGEAFRVSWLGIVSLLRAVGHVLRNVDGGQSDDLRRVIDARWKELQDSRPEPAIFWQFIEPERNRFLKNYAHSVDRWLPALQLYNQATGEPAGSLRLNAGISQGMGYSGEEPLESAIRSGPFAGMHERELARRAQSWWKAYLDDIDRRLVELRDG